MSNFLDYYELYSSTDNFQNYYCKDALFSECRFCGKNQTQISFDTIPHVIPELFGRNNITSNFECDECNRKFQRYESDVSTMVQHYLSLLRVKTKKGVPNFQSKKEANEYPTTIKTLDGSQQIYFGANAKDFTFDDEKGSLTINFRTRNFRPFSIYKVFLKIGIALLNEEDFKNNSHFLEFLHADEPIRNGMQVWTVYRYMLKTKYFATPKANLYKAKATTIGNKEFPEFVLLMNFANITFQFFLPISSKNALEHKEENILHLEAFPAFVLEDIGRLSMVDLYHFDLDETNKISITDTITLYYDERVNQPSL